MNKRRHLYIFTSLSLLIQGGAGEVVFAQNRLPHSHQYMQVAPAKSTVVPFAIESDISLSSIPEQPLEWGMDVAWNSEDNVVRGTNFIGKDVLKVGRVSFQPSDKIGDSGELSTSQRAALQSRLNNIAKSGVTDIILNCDHEVLCNKDNYPNADQNYANYYGKPDEWVKVIKASVVYCQHAGFNVVAVSPFNEPDYTDWKEGTQSHFKEIARRLREDSFFDNIRISAGNTLNCDKALSWYNAVKPYVNEGNTHQLAGSFDNYAKFWETVRSDGNHATADEVHNVGEAFIGAHYGMQTAIWWGFEGATRGAYCRSSYYGKEIGYGENRDAWSAATVYKREDGRMDAFLGTSERQATPSNYEFVSTDHPAFYEGYGPMYTYGVSMPGGTGYQKGQTNAEHMVAIHSGEDVPVEPIIDDSYVLMNKKANLCIGYLSDGSNNGTSLALRKYSTNAYTTSIATKYLWKVESVKYVSGDMAHYFYLRWGKNNSHVMDIKDWSREEGGTMIGYTGGLGINEQWYLEYAGDNFWYIRSRHSGLYLQPKNGATSENTVIQQAFFTGNDEQCWRFLPASAIAKMEQDAPEAPIGLKADVKSASVCLSWNANTDSDLAAYEVLRDGDVIGRMIEGTEFLDNDAKPGVEHQYIVKAIDKSRNRSLASAPVTALIDMNQRNLLAHYDFETDSLDASPNQLDLAASAPLMFSTITKKQGNRSLQFNASSPSVMIPSTVGHYRCFTWAAWVNVSSLSTARQHIFDFGNDADHCCYLTPSTGSYMRLVFKNGDIEQGFNVSRPSVGWHYLAVTVDEEKVSIYYDGTLNSSSDITLRLDDIAPKRCFLGQSQSVSDPLFTGYLDDVRIYSFALTLDELKALNNGEEVAGIDGVTAIEESGYYNLQGQPVQHPANGFYISNGRKVKF